MHKKNNGYILATVITFIFISMFVIFGSSYIFSRFVDNMEVSDIYSDAEITLGNQYNTFLKTLVYTNTDGGGYMAVPPEKHDINNDDDDYNGTSNDTDGVIDDDGDAFKYKFGIALPEKEENVLLLDEDYFIDNEHYIKDFPNGRNRSVSFSISTLSGIVVYLDKSAEYRIEVFDGSIYKQDGLLKQKSVKKGVISPGDQSPISLKDLNINEGDIVAMFLTNVTDESLSYRISGIDQKGDEINYFMPVVIKEKNFDLYTSIIKKDKFGYYLVFKKYFQDVLTGGKKPIAPSYLDGYGSGSSLVLNWDINDLVNTGAYYLFRGPDKNVDCTDEYFLSKISSGSLINSYSSESYLPGTYYYTLCSSNSPGGQGFEDAGTLSTHSNIIGISGNQFVIDWTDLGNNGTTGTSTGTTGTSSGSTGLSMNINGVCGLNNNKQLSSIPTTNLCLQGTAGIVNGTGPWTWQCMGIGNGTNANCSSYSNVGTSDNPGLSCQDILDRGGNDGSLIYRIKPDANPAMRVYCDMTTDGGGWTKTTLITRGSTTRDAYNIDSNTDGAILSANFNIAMKRFSGDTYGEDLEYMIKRDGLQVGNIYTDVNKGAWNNMINCGVSGCFSTNPSAVFDNNIKYKSLGTSTRTNWTDTFAHNWNAWNWSIASGPNRATQGFILHSSSNGEDGSLLYVAKNSTQIYAGDTTWTYLEVFVRKRKAIKLGELSSNPGIDCFNILNSGGSSGDGMYWIKPDSNPAVQTYCYMSTAFPAEKSCLDHKNLGRNTNGIYRLDPDGVGGNPQFQAFCDMNTDGGGWTLINSNLIGPESGTAYSRSFINSGSGVNIQITASMVVGCNTPFTQHMVSIAPSISWSKIKFTQEFNGGNSCWAIFGAGGTGYNTNIIPFDKTIDNITNQLKMNTASDNIYDGVNSRCDNNTTNNFRHSNKGTGLRYATVTLRKSDLNSPGNLYTMTNCTTNNSIWTYKDIYVR